MLLPCLILCSVPSCFWYCSVQSVHPHNQPLAKYERRVRVAHATRGGHAGSMLLSLRASGCWQVHCDPHATLSACSNAVLLRGCAIGYATLIRSDS